MQHFSNFKRSRRTPSPLPDTQKITRPQSTHYGVDVPNELWVHITRYLSDEELYKLIGVNSVFLELGLRCKWGSVVIDMEDVPLAIHILTRLNEPFIAGKVDQLILRLRQFKKPIKIGEDTRLRKRLVHRLGLDHYISKAPAIPTVADAVNSLITAIPYLTRVRELHVDLWEFPNDLLLPLFRSVCACFGNTLRTLCLGGDTHSYRFLLEKCHLKFDNLKEIHLELTNAIRLQASASDSETLRDVVALFIGSLAPTLEVFRVWCWATVDMSEFYKYLAQVDFKMLTTIRIGTAFDKLTHDSSALKDFIHRNSSTLTRLELRLTPSRVQLDPNAENPLGAWLDDFVSEDLRFPNLQTLEIYPTSTAEGYRALLALINRTAPTLLDLVIRDRYFTPPQAKQVIEASAQTHLRFLRMGVMQLDVELLDLIAESQRDLERIWLSVSANVGGGGDTLRQQLQKKIYNHWKLKDVHLWQSGQEMEVETLLEVARAVPSVVSFFGVSKDALKAKQQLPPRPLGSDLVEW